jgi:hypothetical protein
MTTYTKPSDVSGRSARIRPLLGAAILAAAVTAGLLSSTAEASSRESLPKQTPVHIVAFEPWDEGGTVEIDNGEAGFGPGDQFLEHHRLLDPETGDDIGQVTKEITVIETTPDGDFLFMVHSEFAFDHGTVQDAGALWYSEVQAGTATVAATGGTGAYAHTTGTVRGASGERDGSPGVFLTLNITRNR